LDASTLGIVGVVGIVVANQAVLRVASLWRNPWTFWGLQAFNMALGIYLLIFGLPILAGLPFVSIILGLLVLLRVLQNNLLRTGFLREARAAETAAERRELQERIRSREAESAGDSS